VQGVDLRGETHRLWAREHQSRWRLRLARPSVDTMADTPELGRALAEFAAACAAMAQPAGSAPGPRGPEVEDAVPAFLGRAAGAARAPFPVSNERPPERPPVTPTPVTASANPDDELADLERRVGLRSPEG
jgi:hypothetical protein